MGRGPLLDIGPEFGEGSCYVPDDPSGLGPDGLSAPGSSEAILIIYLHGSELEYRDDMFVPRGQWSTTPRVVSSLSGADIAGRRVVVFAHGSPEKPAGRKNDSIAFERTKIARRFDGLRSVVLKFERAGYSRERIFLAGHSAGAWLALWVLALNPNFVRGAIALAPAFAGSASERAQGWEAARQNGVQDMSGAQSLPALVYAFENDEWES